MALSETSICNQALGKLGAKRINDFETDNSTPGIQCRLHYELTRDALLRSHAWRFARARKALVQDTVDPVFEYDNQFILPTDFLALKSVYENRYSDENIASFVIEGKRLLTNNSTVNLRYIKTVTDPREFDPLFVKLLVLLLADELIGPLVGGDKQIQAKIDAAIKAITPAVMAVDGQETNTIGTDALASWNDARYSG